MSDSNPSFQMAPIPTRQPPPLPYPSNSSFPSSSSSSSVVPSIPSDEERIRSRINDPFSTVLAELKNFRRTDVFQRTSSFPSRGGRPASNVSPEKSRNDEMWKAIDDLSERVSELEDKVSEVLKNSEMHINSVQHLGKLLEDAKTSRQKIEANLNKVNLKVDQVSKSAQQEISRIEAKVSAKSLYEQKTQSLRDYRSQFLSHAPGWFLLGLMTVIEPLRRLLQWIIGVLWAICYRKKGEKDAVSGSRSPISSPHGKLSNNKGSLSGSNGITQINTNLNNSNNSNNNNLNSSISDSSTTTTPRPRRRMSVALSPTLSDSRDEVRSRFASL